MNFNDPSDEKINLAGFLLVSILGLAAGAGIGIGLSSDLRFGAPSANSEKHGAIEARAGLKGVWTPSDSEKARMNRTRNLVPRGLRAPDSVPDSNEIEMDFQARPPTEDLKPQGPQSAPPKRSSPGRAEAQPPVRVAVIDTGIDFDHPELAAHIEKESAWDFVSETPNAKDPHGHGTHIAGLIVREAKLPQLKLIPLRYYADGLNGGDALRLSVRAFYRAIALKVDIINYSGGGARPSREELDALRAANAAGILVVAASGNEGSNADRDPFYPASYALPNLISVTATSASGDLLPTSNWGRGSVQMATVGEDLVSTLPGGREGKMTGTSQATALVTAAAVRLIADLKARDLDTSPELLRAALEVSGSRESRLEGRTASARFFDQDQVLRRKDAGWQRRPSGAGLQKWRAAIASSMDPTIVPNSETMWSESLKSSAVRRAGIQGVARSD